MSNGKIIDRIQKLLALATSTNVNEAAAAAAQAQRLMTEHRISTAALEGHSTSSGPAVPIVNEAVGVEKSRIPWKDMIAYGLAKANGCKSYTHLGKPVTTRFIGREDSIQTVKYMYEYLVREVDRLAADERKHETKTRTWLRDFRMGAANTISQRLIASSAEVVATAPGAAMVVINKDLARVDEKYALLGKMKTLTNKVSDKSAYSAGAEAGKKVNLTTGRPLGKGHGGSLKD